MKCISKKLNSNKSKLESEEQLRKREELLSKMSDEEREEFLQKEKDDRDARHKRVASMLGNLAGIYSALNIDEKYKI